MDHCMTIIISFKCHCQYIMITEGGRTLRCFHIRCIWLLQSHLNRCWRLASATSSRQWALCFEKENFEDSLYCFTPMGFALVWVCRHTISQCPPNLILDYQSNKLQFKETFMLLKCLFSKIIFSTPWLQHHHQSSEGWLVFDVMTFSQPLVRHIDCWLVNLQY